MNNFDGNLAALNTYQAEQDAFADVEVHLESAKQEFLDDCYTAVITGSVGAVECFQDWVSENPEVFTRLLRQAHIDKKADNEIFMKLSDWCFEEFLGKNYNCEDIDSCNEFLGLV